MTSQATPSAEFELQEFVPPEHVPPVDPDEPPRPSDFLFLIPILVIFLGLGIGWYMKWKDTVPPLPKDWNPACAKEVPSWQLFHPPPELSYHSQPGEWVLGYAEVGVRWHGQQSYRGPQASGMPVSQDALTTSTGEPTFLTTLVGNQLSGNQQFMNPKTTLLDAGLTSNTVWFLGEIGTSGTILELAARGTGSQVVTPLHLPASLPDATGKQVPVTWLARDYGDDKLLLIGLDAVHASPEFAELQVIKLPSGTNESTVRVPLHLQRFTGEVDEATGTILLTSRYSPPESWRMHVMTGVIEPLASIPETMVETKSPQYWIGGWMQPGSGQAPSATHRPSAGNDVAYWSRPGVALVCEVTQTGNTATPQFLAHFSSALSTFDPDSQAHPQAMYLKPNLGLRIFNKSLVDETLDAVSLQSELCTTDPIPVDPPTLAAMQASFEADCVTPLKLHPINIDDVLVTQLIRPGNRNAGQKSGLVRLGWLDQKTLAITWLAWWPLPPQEFKGERQADCTFAMTGDTGWLLVAGVKGNGTNITPATTCYAAHMISAFPDWLDDHLNRKSTP